MKRHLKHLLGACAMAAATTVSLPDAALAEGGKITVRNTTGFERDGDVVDASATDPLRSELVWHARSAFTVDYRKPLENRRVFSFSQTVEGDLAPGHRSLDRLEFETAAQFQFDLDEERKWQARLQGEYTHSHGRETRVFDRVRVGAQLRHKHNPKHLSRARVRIGYRDQNDDLFVGFDQTEYLFELGHDWRPNQDRENLSVTAYAELRRAEGDQFSYDEVGLRLAYRHPVSEKLEVTGRLSGFIRDYDGVFSPLHPARRDRRLQAQIEGAYKITDKAALVAFAGWETNWSNIDMRHYSGPIAGLRLEVTLGSWED